MYRNYMTRMLMIAAAAGFLSTAAAFGATFFICNYVAHLASGCYIDMVPGAEHLRVWGVISVSLVVAFVAHMISLAVIFGWAVQKIGARFQALSPGARRTYGVVWGTAS
jgi:hypothetical protein